MSSEIINTQIKKTLPGLGNFYMAGQWATRGGVVSSLYSGAMWYRYFVMRTGAFFGCCAMAMDIRS